jgi:hypothetical protein
VSKKVIAFGCWNNEMPISIPHRAGALHSPLFTSEKAARDYFDPKTRKNCSVDDVIVRVTCEVIDSSDNGTPRND